MKRLQAFFLGLLLVVAAGLGSLAPVQAQLATVHGGKAAVSAGGGGEVAGGAITYQSTSAVSKIGTVGQIDVTCQTVTAGWKLLYVHILRTSTNETPTGPAGWSLVTSAVGGVGSWAAESGDTRVTIWEKTAAGTEGGTTVSATWTDTTSSSSVAFIIALSGANAGWQTTTATSGEDETALAISVTGGGTLTFLQNDLLLAVYGTNTSNGAGGSETLTATGATLGSVAVRVNDSTFIAFDAAVDAFTAPVSSGTATVAPQGTLNWSEGATPAATGVMVFVRIRNA